MTLANSRNGINASARKRMAAQKPADGIPAAPAEAVALNGLNGIGRTGRIKPAVWGEKRRNATLVKTNP